MKNSKYLFCGRAKKTVTLSGKSDNGENVRLILTDREALAMAADVLRLLTTERETK